MLRPGSVIRLEAKETADDRTRERIEKNNSSGFVVRECVMSSEALGGRPGLLLESLQEGGSRGQRWMGWLASDDVELL
tara:strand:- start:1231 stop:1464 length:234 start_codon:yes stop_codon:yes gene_type:complete